MASLVMGCPCTYPVMMIPSSTTSASTSSTSSACFRTCQTSTKSLRKPTSMIMSAVVQSSLITPGFTVSQMSSWPTLNCVLLSVRTTGRTTHALLAPRTRTSGMPFKHMQPSSTRNSTPTWRDNLMPGTPSSSQQAQLSSMWMALRCVDRDAPPAKKTRFSLTFNGGSAAAGTPPTPPAGLSSEDSGERIARASPILALATFDSASSD
jgi:hypothetical protein